MNKTIPAIALAVMTAAAPTPFAQPPGWGQGPGYGPCGGLGANCPRAQGPALGAQAGQGTSEDWASARVERMAARLNLTAEQKDKLATIFRERQAIRDAQRQALHDQIAAILTPEQRAQFDRMQGQRGMGRRGGGPGGMGYGRGPGYAPGPIDTPQN